MKTFISFLMLIFMIPVESNFCECPIMSDKFASRLKEISDLIVIGETVKYIELNDRDQFSYENIVKFKIDSVIKGSQSLKTIFVNQNNAGNCSIWLKKGEKYLITGDKVNSAEQTYSMTQKSHDKKLDELINENYMLITSGCRSFPINSRSAKIMLK